MADPTNYLMDENGQVEAFSPEETEEALATGYRPAGQSQIDDFKKQEAFKAKYGGTEQAAKAFAEGAAQTLTFGTSTALERAWGAKAADIENREKAHGTAHTLGALTGVAAPLVLSGGASSFTAPSLIAKAGEGAAELLPEGITEGASLASRLGGKALQGVVSAGTEGALYGASHVVHEAALGDPNLTAQNAIEEIGLSGVLGGLVGGGGGILGGLAHEAAGSELAQKLTDWAENFEGNRNIKSAGGIQSDITREAKKIGLDGVNQLGREGGDLGLVGPFSTPAQTLERSEALMESSGKKMGAILDGADSSGAAPKSFEEIMERVKKNVLDEMEDSPFKEGAAKKIQESLAKYEERFAGRGEDAGLSFRDLHGLRKDISDELYGLRGNMDPGVNYYKSGLHDVRSIVSDEINKGLDSAGIGTKEWKEANREFQVASTYAKFAEKGIGRGVGNNLVSPTELISGIGGMIAGGPAGALLGLGTAAARRYGSGILAAGSKAMRNFIDESAAEGLANKTAELISSERAATATAEEAAGASKLATAFDKLGQRLEPVAAPAKDAARDALQEKAAHKVESEASAEPERVAALSQLAATNKRVNDRVTGLAKAAVSGAKIAKSELTAHAAVTADKMVEEMEHIHQLASNPDMAQEHLSKQTADLAGHAPDTAQAASVTAARAISYLHNKFPAPQKAGPLAPSPKPNQQKLWEYNKTREVLDKPSAILKHATTATLTKEQLRAVASVYPERLAHMQHAVMTELQNSKGSIPYGRRLCLSMLCGQSLDGTSSQQAIASSQLVYALPSQKGPENQTGPGAVRPSQKGFEHLDLAGRAMTGGQGAESRRSQGDA